ncbi:hypothetical protein CCACVL1_28302 [Corchorus capsularis]|uniref:Uncharacterized protein n=1 Tax=Corchorus capsularis TaxID=210143 RepID=A0A1R3G6X4_COCAP|nr:hypothetical protein CCACVL1_28302 [Corchorus capsularis]
MAFLVPGKGLTLVRWSDSGRGSRIRWYYVTHEFAVVLGKRSTDRSGSVSPTFSSGVFS